MAAPLKKHVKILVLTGLSILLTACPSKLNIEYITIKSARVLLFSFSELGIFPHTASFTREELGIGVYSDSLCRTISMAHVPSLVATAYAMEPRMESIYTNAIDSISVYTRYNFDPTHPAGSSVNDILAHLDDMGDTTHGDIRQLSDVYINLKFTDPPSFDTLQFDVVFRIGGEGVFRQQSERVILD